MHSQSHLQTVQVARDLVRTLQQHDEKQEDHDEVAEAPPELLNRALLPILVHHFFMLRLLLRIDLLLQIRVLFLHFIELVAFVIASSS